MYKIFYVNIISEQFVSAEFSEDEEIEVSGVLKKKLCIVVLGSSNYAKAFFTNELFKKHLLPVETRLDSLWRPILFKYGEKKSVNLSLPGSFELVHNLESLSRKWHTLPVEDLEVSEGDVTEDTAILEVTLKDSLLKDDCTVLVTPNFSCSLNQSDTSNCSDNGQQGAQRMDQFFDKFLEDHIPITVYALPDNYLSHKVTCF